MLRAALLALVLWVAVPVNLAACPGVREGFVAPNLRTKHVLEWQVYVAPNAISLTKSEGRKENGLWRDPGMCGEPPTSMLRGTVAGLLQRHRATYALLGEIHDSALHHQFRRWLFSHLLDRKPALVFEHIRADQQPALDQFRAINITAAQSGTSADLFRLLDWDKSGWPDQKLFEPLFAAAIQFKLPILPGDPPREKVRAVAKGDAPALTDDERTRLKLDQPLEPKLQDALLTELEASHCGLVAKTAFGNMAMAQRYRDAHLADALGKAADTHGSAVLFAGNGHVRTDRGVPYYLRQMAPHRKVVTVMLLEVEDGKDDPAAYVPRDPDGKPAVDYILFTPRAERKDPCIEMREMFKGKKK